MGWLSDFVSNPIGTLGDTGQKAIDTVKAHPLEAAALAAGGYYFAPEIGGWLSADGTTALAGDATGSTGEALSGIDLGGKGGSPASWLGSATGAGTGAALGAAGSALGGYAVPAAILGSSLLGANAAGSAASTQAAATDRANQIAYQMFQEQKALQQPYVAGGVTAQNPLMDLLGLSGNTTAAGYGSANTPFTPSDLTTDPSYQFRLNEGLKALDRQAAARGGLISGGALKAAQDFGQQSASQEYQNAFNRYQTNRTNMLQPLGNLVASGQNAAANTGTAAGNYGTTAGSNITSGAAAQAAGTVGAANALTGGVSQYLNYNTNNNLLNMLAQQRGTAYGG